MRPLALIAATILAGTQGWAYAASSARPFTLEAVVYGTIKPPQVVGRCIATAVKSALRPLSDSPNNDAWRVDFKFGGTPASVLVVGGTRGSTVAYPKQVSLDNLTMADAIESCG